MCANPKIMPWDDELHSEIHDMLQEPWDLLGHDWEKQNGSISIAGAASATPDKVKRVSLDPTETWMSEDDEDSTTVGMWGCLGGFENGEGVEDQGNRVDACLLPPHVSTSANTWDDPNASGQEDMMMLDEAGDENPSSPRGQMSLATMLEERRARLAASMQRSQASRKCFLEEHLTTRANLARVLNDIEQSSNQVSEHLLHSGGSTSVSSSSSSEESTTSGATSPSI